MIQRSLETETIIRLFVCWRWASRSKRPRPRTG